MRKNMTGKKQQNTLEQKRKNVIAKVIFFSLLAALVLFTNAFVTQRKDEAKTQKQIEAKGVLGEFLTSDQKALQSQFEQQTSELKEQVNSLRAQLEETSFQLLGQGKEQAEEKTNEFINETTLKPLIDKFNDLPDDQKEFVREAVCRE